MMFKKRSVGEGSVGENNVGDSRRAKINLQDGGVLIQTPGSTELVQVQGSLKCSVRFDPEAAQWVVELVDDRGRAGQTQAGPSHATLVEERFAELEMDRAKAYHAALSAAMGAPKDQSSQADAAGRPSRLRRFVGKAAPWVGGAVAAFVVLQVMGLMMGYDEETMRIAQAQKLALEAAGQHAGGSHAAVAAASPGGMVTPDAAGAAMLNPQELAAVKNTPSFQLGSGKGKTLYVFSDPNCPSCQRIEAALEELASDYTVRIVPVAFQNGSEALAGAVMCAPGARVASSWSAGIKTGQAPGSACTEGVSKVQANNALFVKLGFTHTPTLVSESGMLAVGDARADELRQWVDRF